MEKMTARQAALVLFAVIGFTALQHACAERRRVTKADADFEQAVEAKAERKVLDALEEPRLHPSLNTPSKVGKARPSLGDRRPAAPSLPSPSANTPAEAWKSEVFYLDDEGNVIKACPPCPCGVIKLPPQRARSFYEGGTTDTLELRGMPADDWPGYDVGPK